MLKLVKIYLHKQLSFLQSWKETAMIFFTTHNDIFHSNIEFQLHLNDKSQYTTFKLTETNWGELMLYFLCRL